MVKQLVVTCLVALPLTGRASDLCGNPDLKTEPEVLQAACAALKAVNDLDAPALKSLLADDFAAVSVSGKYYGASKAMMVKRWTDPSSESAGGRSDLVELFRAVQTGDVGFVSGTIEDQAVESGKKHCTRHAFTDIWQRRHGKWQWVQAHESGARDVQCEP